MYSSPHAVGPIAKLEEDIIKIVDENVGDCVNSEDFDLIERLHEKVFKQLNFGYIYSVIRWRLEELEEQQQKKLMNGDDICFKSSYKMFDSLTRTMIINNDDIDNLDDKENELLVLLANAIGVKNNDKFEVVITKYGDDLNIKIKDVIFQVELTSEPSTLSNMYEYNVFKQ